MQRSHRANLKTEEISALLGSVGLHHQLTLNVGSTTNKGVVDGASAINQTREIVREG